MTDRLPIENASGLRVMLGPRPGWLNFDASPHAEVAVIGWVRQRPGDDAGVPVDVALLLSRALTQSFRVMFIDPENDPPTTWSDRGDRWVGRFARLGLGNLFRSDDVPLTSTLEPVVAQTLFETASAWIREAQVVILTAPDSLPATLSSRTMADLLDRGRVDEENFPAELWGLMFPGPDGDFAQLIFVRKAALAPFLTRLQHQAASAGVGFELVSPEAFEQVRWFIETLERKL